MPVRGRTRLVNLCAALILTPSLAWLALDRSVWPWDQAWFGTHTIALYETLRREPLAWPEALSRATPFKPPAVAWIGQFFVPVGVAIGSIDRALLLSIWSTHLVALILVFTAMRELSGGRTLVAVSGTLATGAAPIFIALTTQYLAEASQTLAVAWFVLIMSRAPRWSRSSLGLHLLAATSFAMLTKTTSPLYCAGPGLVALAYLVRPKHARPTGSWSVRADAPMAAVALVLAIAAAAWYARNFESAMHHATTAAFGPVAELYGRRESFVRGLVEWAGMTTRVSFHPLLAWPVAALVVWAIATRVRAQPARPSRHLDICAGVAAAQVLAALGAFALSPNRDPRYAAPLLPLVSTLFTWALVQAGDRRITGLATGALVLQLALVHSQLLGLWRTRPALFWAEVGIVPALSVAQTDRSPSDDLAAVVQRTCGRGGFARDNFVGVDLMRLNGHSLTFAAAKERLAGRAGECHYDSIGFASVENAQAVLKARSYGYWITVDPEVHPTPAHFEFLNRSAPVVFRQLRRRGLLQAEPWDGPRGVLLFRFVRR